MKEPSKERGCEGKMKLKKQPLKKARYMAKKHQKKYGVYKCPHCEDHHLTTKLENKDQYQDLIYITP